MCDCEETAYDEGFEDGIKEGLKRAFDKDFEIPSYLDEDDCLKGFEEFLSRLAHSPYYRFKIQEILKEFDL